MGLNLEEIPNYPSWDNIEQYSEALVEKIEADKFHPNYFMPISPGGLVIVGLISLSLPGIPTIGIDIRTDRFSKHLGPNLHIDRRELHFREVLLVDDVLKTDEIPSLVTKLVTQNSGRARVACFFAKSDVAVNPNYFLKKKVDLDIIFPWSRT